MKTIVRIEHSVDGKGMFTSRRQDGCSRICSISNFTEIRDRHRNFPEPRMEIGALSNYFKEGIHFCAFKSVEQMQQWVKPSEIKELLSMGFRVLAIDVSECLEGEYQICFKRNHILETKDISSLFE